MKRLFLFVFFYCVVAFGVSAQSYSINGQVFDEHDYPLAGVNVSISGVSRGAQTNARGEFRITGVRQSSVFLVFSYIGYTTVRQELKLTQPLTTLEKVVLKEETRNLGEIVVTKAKNNRFAEPASEYVAKIPLNNLENPQVYSVISSELLKEQLVINFDDALKNVPGMLKLWESTGRGGDGAGYYSMRGFSVQPTLMNGLPALTHGSPDPANVEQIEVLKGPSGTLYGSSLISYGGLINIVTKKPEAAAGGELSYLTGSYGLNRLTADVNTPLDSANRVLFRLNTAYHTENSFQDAGFAKSFFLAPTLSFKASDRLSFFVVAEFLQSERTNPTMLFVDRGNPLTYTDFDDIPYDPKRSYTSNNLSIKNPMFSLQMQMNYRLSSSWMSQTAVSRGITKADGYYSYLYEGTAAYPGLTKGMVFNRYVNDQNATTDVTDIQQNFTGDFKLGNIRNRVVAGFDFMQINYIDNSTGYVRNGLVYMGDDDPQTVYNTLYGGKKVSNYDNGVLSRQVMDTLLAHAGVSSDNTKQKVFGVYVSDVVNFTPALAVMASLRVDRFEGDPQDDDDDQTALSPKLGMTWQPVLNKLTLFANYMDGFSNVAARQVSEADGSNSRTKTFDPEHAGQFEFGIKTNLWEERISATLSYYDITVKDKVMNDPDNVRDYIQDGEVESKGVELSLVMNPFEGFNTVIGFGHNDSKIVKASANQGKRDLGAGPENTFSFWSSYRFNQTTKLNGLGLGFGLNHIGKNPVINYDTTGELMFPSYTVLNSTIFYEQPKYRLALKVDNLTDLEYYTGWSTINPQHPRMVSVNIAFRF
ncbi:MAG: TonB-dependent siderophore receptor [Mangrovibacterium sp.]